MRLQFDDNYDAHDDTADRLYAAMETGRTGVARMVLGELQAINPEKAEVLRASVIQRYGVSL